MIRYLCHQTLLFAICISFMPGFLNGQRVADQIYLNLAGSTGSQCFRLLNGTHQVGCQSKENGNTGVIYLVESSADLDVIRQDSGNYGQYIAVIDAKNFEELASSLQEMSAIVGVLMTLPDSESLGTSGFSEDAACPNRRTSMYSNDTVTKCEWNPTHTPLGSRFLDWKKPIFLIDNATEIEIIVKSCWEAFNKPTDGVARPFPVCSATLTQFMTAAKDAVTCLRRQEMFIGLSGDTTLHLCDSLSDENVIAFIPATNKTAQQTFGHESVFVLTARMDSFSMFSDRTPGEESVLSGVIALLAVAKAIGKNRAQFTSAAQKKNKYLLFALLHGESLDYIGSSRMLYDMNQAKFPAEVNTSVVGQVDQMTIDHVGFVFELNQIGSSGDATGHFAHVDGQIYTNVLTHEKIEAVLNETGFKLADDSISARLPPASYQQFLKNSHEIPGIVVGDFQTQFSNKYYNSFADAGNLDVTKTTTAIIEVAEKTLKAVVKWVTVDDPSTVYTIDAEYVTKLYDCFITRKFWDECEIFQRAMSDFDKKEKADAKRKITFIGTAGVMSAIKRLTTVLMVDALGEKLQNVDAKQQCGHLGYKNNMYSYYWQLDLSQTGNTSYCYQSTVMLTAAESPAFAIEDYDMTSGQYSTWVESVWTPSSLKLFLQPPPHFSLWVCLTALAVLIVSLGVCLLLHHISPMLIDAHPGADIGDPSL